MSESSDDRGLPRLSEPLDAADPRFGSAGGGQPPQAERRLVRSQGPGPSQDDPRVRTLRIALPLLFLAGLVAVALVFFAGLRPGPPAQPVGPEPLVRAAVAQRPKRVCLGGANPCAWLTVIDGRLLAFNTSGPLPQEYGRQGIGWCPRSGHFGSNATGSRFDQQGRLVRGPAPRGLDRFAIRIERGRVVVDFAQLSAGQPGFTTTATSAPDGRDCARIPFDRNADLEL